jgi:putative spermidine/putrescine transport system permease protein
MLGGGDERASYRPWLLLLPSAILYACVFALPLGVLLSDSVRPPAAPGQAVAPSLAYYQAFWTDGVTFSIFLSTVWISILVTAACVVLGYPLALFMRRAGPRLRIVVLALVVSPLLTSVIVRNVAWLLVLGNEGLINTTLRALGIIDQPLPLLYNTFGVVVGVTHVYLSFVVLPLFASLLAIDPSLEENAASLGASPWRIFAHVTLPLSLPGLVAGMTLVFILSMGIYLTPVIMGGSFVTTLAMTITDLVRNQYDWSRAAAFSVMLLAFIGAVLLLSYAATRQLSRARGREAAG